MSKSALRMTAAQVQEHQRKHGFISDSLVKALGNHVSDAEKSVISASKGFRLAKQPNKTENEFGAILEARRRKGEFTGPVRFEAVKLRIAGNCYYTPDWMTTWESVTGAPVITFYEVKGAHIWEDSKVKFKAAKELHPWASFEMWQKKAGEWRRIA
jgi:hypothetical protein